MARQTNKIDNVYIADGLAEDCEELILKCSQVSKLSFEKFSDIWRDMEFSTIYYGRPSGAELAEFSEETLHVAKFFMVSNINNNFEKSVAGLFLVYAMLNLQPFPRLAPLRLVPEDVAVIQKLEFVARRERRHDILYILGDVLIRGPCQFHVAVRERGLDFCLRKYFDGYTQHSVVGKKPIGVFHRHNEELEIIRELSYLEERYEIAKNTIISGSEPDRSLQYANGRLAKDLQSSLKTVVSGIVVQNCSERPEDSKEKVLDHCDSVKAIKEKAMKKAVDPIKHLTRLEDRNKTLEKTTKKTKPKKSKEYKKLLNEKPKNPSDSSESPIISPKPYPWSLKLFNQFDEEETSPLQHKPYNNAQKISPSKRLSTSESPTKPDQGLMVIDMEPLEISNNDINPTKSPKTPIKKSPRKNVTPKKRRIERILSFDESTNDEPVSKKFAPESAKDLKSTENVFTINDEESQHVELTIGQLPIELSAQNNNVEVEIIDLYTGKEAKKTIKFENGKNVGFKSHDSLEGGINGNKDHVMEEPSTSKTYYENSNVLRKHMKLTKLKSRIKRLGVDEVVDFESEDSSDDET